VADEIVELLKALYERNVDYHNVKERVVWLAGVVYLTFSAALMAWYFQNRDTITFSCLEKYFTAAFLSVVFLLTATFILRQTWHKVRSTVKTEQFFKLIRKLPNRRTHVALMNANEYNFDKKREPVCDFVCMGWSGHLILGVVYSFFLAQLIALYGFPKGWVWSLILILPAVAFVAVPPLACLCYKNRD
jgi:hypothetical protein